jgi:hypothetical protein
LLRTEGGDDGNKALLLTFFEDFLNFLDDIREVLGLREVDVRFDLAIRVQELKSRIVDVEENVLISSHDGSIDHVTSVVGALVGLGGENISALKDDLGGTVLTRLGSGNISNLARVALDHDKGADLESRGIGLFGLRSTGVSQLELFILFSHVYN